MRYLGFILAGILLYRYREKITVKNNILCASAGIFFVILLDFVVDVKIFFGLWRNTSLPVVFWAASWVMLALLIRQPKGKNIFYDMIGRIGRASYCVFLTQMLWYFIIKEGWMREPVLPVSIVVCCLVGVVFSHIDKCCQRKVKGFFNV